MNSVSMSKEILDVINAVVDYGRFVMSHNCVVPQDGFDQYALMEKYYHSLPLPEGMAKNRTDFERILQIGWYSDNELKLLNNFEQKELSSVNWKFDDIVNPLEVVRDGKENSWLIMSDSVIVRPSFSAEEIAEEAWKAGCFDVLEFDDEIACDEYPGKVYVAFYQIDVNDVKLLDAKKDVLEACGREDMMDQMDEISPELWAKELVTNDRSFFEPIGYAPEGDGPLDKYMITYEQLNDVLIKLGAPEELIERGSVTRLLNNAASKCEEVNKDVACKNDVEFVQE